MLSYDRVTMQHVREGTSMSLGTSEARLDKLKDFQARLHA